MTLPAILVLAGLSLGADEPIGSYLYQPCYSLKDAPGPAVAYLPQPGDVLLATDKSFFWSLTHDLAFAFEPHNSAVVVARPDGSLAILEAGPNDVLWCLNLDMLPHLKEYHDKGPVWIRKRKTPLSPEQCERLTAFAMRQEGKRFALARLGKQLTIFRERGPLRTFIVGKPHGDRSRYYCAELAMEALVAAGALDPETTRPSATYPHDLFFDESFNIYISRHLPLACDYEPPARWTYCPK
jgi:hypothetical protein